MRIKLGNLLCPGIIPGPHGPKDFGSFMVPLDDELAKLAYGVSTYNAIDRSLFSMHAYLIHKHGDIVAIEKMLGIKGHNGISPC